MMVDRASLAAAVMWMIMAGKYAPDQEHRARSKAKARTRAGAAATIIMVMETASAGADKGSATGGPAGKAAGPFAFLNIFSILLKLFSEIVLTRDEKACNIIQVVSERNAASDGEQLPGCSGRASAAGFAGSRGFEKHFKKVLDKNR